MLQALSPDADDRSLQRHFDALSPDADGRSLQRHFDALPSEARATRREAEVEAAAQRLREETEDRELYEALEDDSLLSSSDLLAHLDSGSENMHRNSPEPSPGAASSAGVTLVGLEDSSFDRFMDELEEAESSWTPRRLAESARGVAAPEALGSLAWALRCLEARAHVPPEYASDTGGPSRPPPPPTVMPMLSAMPPDVPSEPSEPRAEPSEPRAEPSEPRAEPSEPRAEPSEPRAEPSEPRAEPSGDTARTGVGDDPSPVHSAGRYDSRGATDVDSGSSDDDDYWRLKRRNAKSNGVGGRGVAPPLRGVWSGGFVAARPKPPPDARRETVERVGLLRELLSACGAARSESSSEDEVSDDDNTAAAEAEAAPAVPVDPSVEPTVNPTLASETGIATEAAELFEVTPENVLAGMSILEANAQRILHELTQDAPHGVEDLSSAEAADCPPEVKPTPSLSAELLERPLRAGDPWEGARPPNYTARPRAVAEAVRCAAAAAVQGDAVFSDVVPSELLVEPLRLLPDDLWEAHFPISHEASEAAVDVQVLAVVVDGLDTGILSQLLAWLLAPSASLELVGLVLTALTELAPSAELAPPPEGQGTTTLLCAFKGPTLDTFLGAPLPPSAFRWLAETGPGCRPLDLFTRLPLFRSWLGRPVTAVSVDHPLLAAPLQTGLCLMKAHALLLPQASLAQIFTQTLDCGYLAGLRLVYPAPSLSLSTEACLTHASLEHLRAPAGRILVLAIRGARARERLSVVFGPADPALAKRTDPASLRAKFGSDRKRNMAVLPSGPATGREMGYWFGGRVVSPRPNASPAVRPAPAMLLRPAESVLVAVAEAHAARLGALLAHCCANGLAPLHVKLVRREELSPFSEELGPLAAWLCDAPRAVCLWVAAECPFAATLALLVGGDGRPSDGRPCDASFSDAFCCPDPTHALLSALSGSTPDQSQVTAADYTKAEAAVELSLPQV